MAIIPLLKFITNHPLNRDRKAEALMRFARWQLASRAFPADIVCEWVNGARFFARNGETGLTQNIYTGLQEFPDMAYVLHVLRSTDLFVDIGANVGSYTILACKGVGASGIAVEPIPATYIRLQENIRLNRLENTVVCLNIGIGEAAGTIRFTDSLDTVNHALANGESDVGTIDVQVSMLDGIMKDNAPSLIKIDVEGYETPVLKGAAETLQKASLHSVIMELNGSGARYNYQESKILDMMLDHGFATYTYEPFTRSLKKLKGKSLQSGNTLFIRDVDHVTERLRAAPKINVLGKEL
ncbi:MAG TPA: FkbM family methyltransferase [Steroidobacteraceae bacterium]|jgi:FkbM family methyltransferase|nr:FkbM family methyltransferase [Steroidobacteraceae bacterium]